MPPGPLISKLHELRAGRSSWETAIELVLELLRLGVTELAWTPRLQPAISVRQGAAMTMGLVDQDRARMMRAPRLVAAMHAVRTPL